MWTSPDPFWTLFQTGSLILALLVGTIALARVDWKREGILVGRPGQDR